MATVSLVTGRDSLELSGTVAADSGRTDWLCAGGRRNRPF